MKLFDQIKQFANGASIIKDWLGHEGVAVDKEIAQKRADICIACPKNVAGLELTETVAKSIREQIECKNHAQLRVEGEKSLHHCTVCACVIRLMVWCPAVYLYKHTTEAETSKYPSWCWKSKKE